MKNNQTFSEFSSGLKDRKRARRRQESKRKYKGRRSAIFGSDRRSLREAEDLAVKEDWSDDVAPTAETFEEPH
jgi:hypothetical protein